MREFALRLVLMAAFVLATAHARASVLRSMDLVELTHVAETIAVGSVLSTTSAWDPQRRAIYSTVEIAVDETWKGSVQADGRLRLRHWGGSVGDVEMTVHGEGCFQEGERVVVFARGGRLVGMGQGKRRLAWDTKARRWMAAPWQHGGAAVVGNKDVRSEWSLPLDALRAQVRALVAQ